VDRPAEPALDTSRAIGAYVVVAVSALLFCAVAGSSIGVFFLPVPVAMFLGLFAWRWKWAVAGLVAGAIAGSFAWFLTVPLTRFEASSIQGGVQTQVTGCGRAILADLPDEECGPADQRAVIFGVSAALVIGVGTSLVVKRVARPRSP
jgi:hypothetical protein